MEQGDPPKSHHAPNDPLVENVTHVDFRAAYIVLVQELIAQVNREIISMNSAAL